MDGTEELTVDQKYHKVLKKLPKEGCGRFQFFVFLIFISGQSCFGYIFYILSFLELFPQFNCQLPDGTWQDDCSTE